VKHPLADVLMGVEHLRSLVYGAATAAEDGARDAPAEAWSGAAQRRRRTWLA